MHSISSLILFLVLLTCTFASDVVVLTDSNFESKIKEYDTALVKFYAPWCGHCQRMASDFKRAATRLAKNDPPVTLVDVDCTAQTKTCAKYGVNGYPSLKIFKSGVHTEDFNGPRGTDGIVITMKSKAGSAYRVLNTVADYEKFLAHNDHSIVGYFDNDTHSLRDDLVKTAGLLSQKFRFAYTTAKEVLEKAGQSNNIVIHQPPRFQSKFEQAYQVVEGVGEQIKSYIQEKIHGLVGHRTSSNADDYAKPIIVVYYNVDYVRDTKGTNYVRNRILKVAKKLADENVNIRFAISNADDFRQELEEFGISDVKKDAKYVLARGSNNEKYRLTEDFSVEALENFARKLTAGELKPYLKSQAVPKQTEDVKVVVASTFDEIVNDNTKDVLIEFYAPWCGHCKSFAPIYNDLANRLKNENSIVIAKMDATENDVPSAYDVPGYPTIYYAPKNDKNNPKKYDAGRDVKDFLRYLAKESTDGFTGYDRDGTKKEDAGSEL